MAACDDIVFLGTLNVLRQRYTCPLCQFVLHSLSSSGTSDYQGDLVCTLNPRHGSGGSFALICGDGISCIKAWIRIECPPHILDRVTHIPSPTLALDSPRPEDLTTHAHTLDPNQIRSWLHECETKHGERCNSHGLGSRRQGTSDLLLIDVIEGMVVHGDSKSESRYLALSYVWGEWGGSEVFKATWQTYDMIQTKGALWSSDIKLPNVLLDAMELTKAIGERYLWCDAICVLQDSYAQKEQQLGQMDKIYGNAFLTIVALSGTHGNQPIPGVRNGTRRSAIAIKEVWGGVQFISRAPSLDVLVAGSVYESRAWTFQEKLLSNRCLFIANQQAFFQCSVQTLREDEGILGRNKEPAVASLVQARELALAPMLKALGPFGLYSYLVENYSCRQLTNLWDVLGAFKGISKALESPLKGKFIEGVPSGFLNHALLWSPTGRIQARSLLASQAEDTRRVFIPSWSWAGWVGQVCYDWPFEVGIRNPNENGNTYQLQEFVQGFVFVAATREEGDYKTLHFQHAMADRVQYAEFPSGLGNSFDEFRIFVGHFIAFGLQVIGDLIGHLRQHVFVLSEVGRTDWAISLDAVKDDVEDFLASHRWMLSKTPFASMPSFEELKISAKKWEWGDYPSYHDFNFWPFTSITYDIGASETGPCQMGQMEEFNPSAWPFKYIPSRATLLQEAWSPSIRSGREMGFWANRRPFDSTHISGGQLFRNSFSMSSQSTTLDGTAQCDLAKLTFTADKGVTPGNVKQPATLLRGENSMPYGIILEEEEDICLRVRGRQCSLVLLSKSISEGRELWHNYMLVADRNDSARFERLAIARLVPNTQIIGEKLYICLR